MKGILHSLVYLVLFNRVTSKPYDRPDSENSCAKIVINSGENSDQIRIPVGDRIINNSRIGETDRKQWSNLAKNSSVDSVIIKNGCLLRICRFISGEPFKRQKCDLHTENKTFVEPTNGDVLNDCEESDAECRKRFEPLNWDKQVSSVLNVDCSCKTPNRTQRNVVKNSTDSVPEECPLKIEASRCASIKLEKAECARLYQETDCTSCSFGYVSIPISASVSKSTFHISGKSMISSVALNDECSLTAYGYHRLDGTHTKQYSFTKTEFVRFANINDQSYSMNNFTCICPLSSYPDEEGTSMVTSGQIAIFLSVAAILLAFLGGMSIIGVRLIQKYFLLKGWDIMRRLKGITRYDRIDIRREGVIKGGQFGVVYEGLLQLKTKPRKWVRVALKYVKSYTNPVYLNSIVSEIDFMGRIGHHDNIVHFYGWCPNRDDKTDLGDVCIIMELCLCSLKQYFEDNRLFFRDTFQPMVPNHYYRLGMENALGNSLTSTNLVKWSLEIATGMEYISSQNIAHFDLAVRNILLTEDLTAKIADYGLSQNLLKSHYIVFDSENNNPVPLPVFYMAPESLLRNRVSVKADVWSFAVCVWEIFSLGQDPTIGDIHLCDQNIIRQVLAQQFEEGVRLAAPDSTTPEIYEKLLECWKMDPESRPSFTNLKEFFSNQLESLKQMSVNDLPLLEVPPH